MGVVFKYDGEYVGLGYHLSYHMDPMRDFALNVNKGVITIYAIINKDSVPDQAYDDLMCVLEDTYGKDQAASEWEAIRSKVMYTVSDLGGNEYEVSFDSYQFTPQGDFQADIPVNEGDLDIVQDWVDHVREGVLEQIMGITVY